MSSSTRDDMTREGISPAAQLAKDIAGEEAAARGARYLPSTQGAYLLEDTETERLMTGAEFTEMYQNEIAKHRTRGDGNRVSFGEKLFGPPQQRSIIRQKSSSKTKTSKDRFAVLSSPVKRSSHRRTQSAPRGSQCHVAGSAAGTSGAATRSSTGGGSEGPGALLESYITHFDAKFRRRQIPRTLPDAEALYIEIIELKQRMVDMEGENVALRTLVRKREKEKVKLEKRVEELIANGAVLDNNALRSERAVAEGHLIQNLRGKIRVLETNLTLTTEELHRLKLDGKYLRVRELETEVKAYYSEARRLQRILDQMIAARNKDSEKQAMDEALALLQDKEQVIVRLRETIGNLKQTVKQNRQELDRLIDEKERQRQESERRIENLHDEGGEYRQLAQTRLEEVQSLTEKLKVSAQAIEAKEEEVRQARDHTRKVRAELEILMKEHTELVTEHKQMLAHNTDLEAELKDLQQDLQVMGEKYRSVQASHDILSRQVRSGTSEADVCKEQNVRMREEYEALVNERDELLKENRHLHEEMATLKDHVSDLKTELEEEQQAHALTKKRVGSTSADHIEEVSRLRDDYEAELEDLRRAHNAKIEQSWALQEEEKRKALDAQRQAEQLRQEINELQQQLKTEMERRHTVMPEVPAPVLLYEAPLKPTHQGQSDISTSGDDTEGHAADAMAHPSPSPPTEQPHSDDDTTNSAAVLALSPSDAEKPAFSELEDDKTDHSEVNVRKSQPTSPLSPDAGSPPISPQSRSRSPSPSPDHKPRSRDPSPYSSDEDENYSSDSQQE